MRKAAIRRLCIFLGAVGVVFTLAFDLFKPGPADFGRHQLMGFVVSMLILLAGLRNTFQFRRRQLDAVMLWAYLAGMFYLVLMPRGFGPHSGKKLLAITEFLPVDFGINILGFVPLGYLLMSRSKPQGKAPFGRYMAVVLFGLLLSLFIEVVQYYIPGRTSAINDLVANTLGGVVGVLFYHFESKMRGGRPG